MAEAGKEIFNPRTGQTIRFVQTARDSAGERLEVECVSQPGREREPVHVHPYQESRCDVESGRLRFWIDGAERVLGPGEGVVVPPGVPHRFWVEGDEEARYRQAFEPALNTEGFFETLFALAREGQLDARGMPPLLLLGAFGQAYWAEIRVTRPPAWAQRFSYALLAPVGRALGRRLPVA